MSYLVLLLGIARSKSRAPPGHLCPGHQGRGEILTHGGKGRAICLFYDDQVGHYEWIDGDVLDELMFWATPHQGTRLLFIGDFVYGGRSQNCCERVYVL